MEIPTSMPYTYQDIQHCKDISLDKCKKNYQTLVKFPADTNPKKFCGNPVLYKYQFGNLLNCRREGKMLLSEIFADEQLKEKLWKDTIKRNRRDKDPYPNATDVYECNRINKGAIVFFKPSTAKYIYKKFKATSVLDPTAGWGGRMLGASSLGIKYTGIDTNVKLKDGYDNMIKDLELTDVNMIWKSCLEVDYSKIDYDLILTSPPYINMEIYEGMKEFDNDDVFYNEFLIKMMNDTYKHLKVGGKMCINISPKMYKRLTERYNYRVCDSQEDLRQQLGKNFVVKSQDYIYIWNK